LARQSENSPLLTGDNEKVLCLGLHSLIYKFITENGAKITIFASFWGFATLWGNNKPSYRGIETFSNAHLKLFEVKSYKYSNL